MSYILDALKRADAERGQLQAEATFTPAQPDRRPVDTRRDHRTVRLWLALGLMAVFATAGWWLYGRSAPEKRVSPLPESTTVSSVVPEIDPATPRPPEPTAPLTAMVPSPSSSHAAPVLPILAPVPPAPSAPAKERVARAQTPVALPGDLVQGIAASNPTPAPAASRDPAVAHVAPALPATPGLPALPSLLSAGDQAGLPTVQISGSSYSANPEHRILIANGQVVKEGQEVAPGLTLEVIGPRSAVFNHRGRRYNINY